MSDPRARLDEIIAALRVRAPSALDRAEQLLAAKVIWEQIYPDARNGGDRRSRRYRARDQTEKISFCSYAARELGCSERNIRLAVKLAEDLGSDLIAALRSTALADSAAHLRRLAALGEADRRSVLRFVGQGMRFLRALGAAGLVPPLAPQELVFRRLVALWAAAGAATRRRFLDHLAATKTARVA